MSLKEQLDGGDLTEAIAEGIAAVKADPTNSNLRYQLFAVLSFAGELHRARKQLGALDVGDPELAQVQSIYINLLASEQERLAVFHHGAEPLLPPDPPAHLTSRLQALRANHAKEHQQADEILGTAIDQQPELSGTINGNAFTGVRDMDDLLGSQLEVFAGGRYLWLPFERISDLKIEEPRHLLDLLWLPAQLTDSGGATSSVHLPVLYESSHQGEDPRTATGRMTEWHDSGGEHMRGCGQRLFGWAQKDTELTEIGILETRSLQLMGEG